jgi:5-formyltetrahydrofolate cyclo-ligase
MGTLKLSVHNSSVREKSQLRQALNIRLRNLSPEDVARKSAAITRQMLASDWWRAAEIIWAFCSMPKEVDTRAIIQAAFQSGKLVVVPRIQQDDMFFHRISSLDANDDFTLGVWGIREPREDLPILRPAELAPHTSLIITPGLAFDRALRRLGRGKGYYDRFLAQIRQCRHIRTRAIGVCLAEQLVDEVPVTPDDQSVDGIITDSDLIVHCPVNS